MNTILVPTDFSQNAKIALYYGLFLAKKFHAELIILNAWNIPQSHSSMLLSINDYLKEAAQKEMDILIQEIREDERWRDVNVSTLITMGEVAWTIKSAAKENNVDLIVMGTKGATGLKKVFIGSNAASVIDDIPCTVICIPEEHMLANPIDKIAFATDMSDDNIYSIKELIKFADFFQAKIDVFHVADLESDKKEKFEQFCVTVNERLNKKINSFKFFTGTEIEKNIEQYVKAENISMLAIATKKRSIIEKFFNSSISKELSFHTQIPLVVFKRGDDN
jgi:nucleotide-binding universal stress UspA family protein